MQSPARGGAVAVIDLSDRAKSPPLHEAYL